MSESQFSHSGSSTERALLALAKVPAFAGLPRTIQLEIAAVAVPRSYEAGAIIYREGEPPDALYILASGWVKSLHLSIEGREQALMFLQSGEIFGDIAVFTDAPYPATVIALEAIETWRIGRSEVFDLLARYPELALAVIRRLSQRILDFVDLVDDLTLRNVEARLARTLLKHTETVDGQLVVLRRRWTTFDEMATRLGTVRDVLGRVLRSLENEGLLRVERNVILILDSEALAQRGEGKPQTGL